MDQFYTQLQMNFISTDILSTNFNVFSNPSVFLYMR